MWFRVYRNRPGLLQPWQLLPWLSWHGEGQGDVDWLPKTEREKNQLFHRESTKPRDPYPPGPLCKMDSWARTQATPLEQHREDGTCKPLAPIPACEARKEPQAYQSVSGLGFRVRQVSTPASLMETHDAPLAVQTPKITLKELEPEGLRVFLKCTSPFLRTRLTHFEGLGSRV